MDSKKALSPAEQKRLAEFSERFKRALAKRPSISDEEFMAETEVSDEEYARGLVFLGPGGNEGAKDG